ncbi:MAG: glycosyltransferase [Desulfobacteraceae bacterium]|nr:glycosyltransferase [Desulfobacteraceae bacterium]
MKFNNSMMYKKNSFFLNKKVTNNKLDLAVVFITAEGIQHISGGVAHYISNFIKTLARLKSCFEEVGVELTLYAAEPALLRLVPTYNKIHFQTMKEIIRKTGGEFYKLVNNTYGDDWIHHVENWKIFSASAATMALNISEKHDATLVFFGSSCLSHTQVYIHKQLKAFQGDIRTVYLTHDSAFSSFWKEMNENILAMDYLCCQWTQFTPNALIGYVSEYMKNLFSEKYMVTDEAFVPAKGGVVLSGKRFSRLKHSEVIDILKKNNIPLDKKIIFSWGRSTNYKRFDLVFRAGKNSSLDLYPVVVTNGTFPSLASYIQHQQIDGMLIENYKSYDVISALLQWHNTQIVCFFAENDPGSIVPMEAMYLAFEAGPIVLTNQTGIYSEIIIEGKNGFFVENKIDDILEKMAFILNLSSNQAWRIRKEAYQTIVDKFDQEKKYIETITHCVPFLEDRYEHLMNSL